MRCAQLYHPRLHCLYTYVHLCTVCSVSTRFSISVRLPIKLGEHTSRHREYGGCKTHSLYQVKDDDDDDDDDGSDGNVCEFLIVYIYHSALPEARSSFSASCWYVCLERAIICYENIQSWVRCWCKAQTQHTNKTQHQPNKCPKLVHRNLSISCHKRHNINAKNTLTETNTSHFRTWLNTDASAKSYSRRRRCRHRRLHTVFKHYTRI